MITLGQVREVLLIVLGIEFKEASQILNYWLFNNANPKAGIPDIDAEILASILILAKRIKTGEYVWVDKNTLAKRDVVIYKDYWL